MSLFRARSGSLSLRASMRSDPGRLRSRNEDACLVLPELGLYAVADGMGGHPAGDVAAREAIARLPDLVRQRLDAAGAEPDAVDGAIEGAVVELNLAVGEVAAGDPRLTGMGTTLVLALTTGRTVRVVHVGDSRAYLLRSAELRRLTEDHSLAAALVDGGVADLEEATRHPFAQSLTQAIGIAGEVHPTLRRFDLAAGDRLLLCSDGLTKMVPEEAIATALSAGTGPAEACDTLVDAANEAGGVDNISVVLIDSY